MRSNNSSSCLSSSTIMKKTMVWLFMVTSVSSLASIAPERTARPRFLPTPRIIQDRDSTPIFDIPDSKLPQLKPVEPTAPPSQSSLVRLGSMLAANSGFLNGLALSGLLAGKKQAVAAVTGAWTTSAISLGSGNVSIAAIQFRMLACYFGGSFLNGLMNPNGINWSESPKALLIMAYLVFVGALFSSSTDIFLSLLALVNGLQNSWTSMLVNGNVLRTAHFSGCTSDMGTFTGQLIRGNTQNVWKLKIFARLAGSFWTGGLLSVFFAKKYEEASFLASVVLYLGMFGVLAIRKANKAVVGQVTA